MRVVWLCTWIGLSIAGCGGRTEYDPVYSEDGGATANRGGAHSGGGGKGGTTSQGANSGQGGSKPATGGRPSTSGGRASTGGGPNPAKGGSGGAPIADSCSRMCDGIYRVCGAIQGSDIQACRRTCIDEYSAGGPTCRLPNDAALGCLNSVLARPNITCDDFAVAIAFGCGEQVEAAQKCRL